MSRDTSADQHSSHVKNSHFTKMCSGSEAGSYLRLIGSCITQLQAQGPSRTCNESKEEEEEAEWIALEFIVLHDFELQTPKPQTSST